MSIKRLFTVSAYLLIRRWRGSSLIAVLWLAGCSSSPVYSPSQPPAHTHYNICALTQFDDTFYNAALRAAKRWGTPVHVLMAFVHRESRFVRDAESKSGAYGYPQAKDATWEEYKKATGNWDASREDIYDAMDFIGWYNYVSHKRLGISRWDAYRLYLAYHEGRGGYKRGTYKRHPKVRKLAQKVANLAWKYRQQMKQCHLAVN